MGDVIINLNISNAHKLDQFLDWFEAEIYVEMLRLYEKAGNKITSLAAALAPVKTGFMRSLIGHAPLPDGVTIVGGADYTSFQEFGTFRIIPKLFITQAIETIMPQIDMEAEEIIDRYLVRLKEDMESIDPDIMDWVDLTGLEGLI